MPHVAEPIPVSGAPALLHARLILPPALDWNGERYCGARLQRIDAAAALSRPGVREVFVRQHLVAVIAESDAAARAARPLVRIRWRRASAGEDLPQQRQRKILLQRGMRADDAPDLVTAQYRWQGAPAATASATLSILARPAGPGIQVDLPYGNPGQIAPALAALLHLPPELVEVRSARPPQSDREARDAANGAGVAALLTLHCKAALSLVLECGIDAGQPTLLQAGARVDADRLERYTLNLAQARPAPPLAWLLTGRDHAIEDAAIAPLDALQPPYAWDAFEISSSGDGASTPAAAAVFAQESFFDEVARHGGHDPVAYRLAHLPDPTGARLVRSVSQAAAWQARAARAADPGPVMHGRGFAYASTIEQAPQPVQSWSAWVAEVAYDPASGELSVTRAIAGHDAQDAAAHAALPPAARGALDEQARQAMARLIAPDAGVDGWSDNEARVPPGAITTHRPPVPGRLEDASSLPSPEVQLKAGGAFTLPAAAAVANAIFDATGVRLREAPFSGAQIKLALAERATSPAKRRWRTAGWLGGAAAALGATLSLALPWRPAIAPIAPPDPNLYSAATIERGRLVALAGDCMVCHTAPDGGIPNAGGHALDTPFGTIYTTNITPDPKTGIGNWSYAAFERAMREGVHRDGRNLYPAFPYTAYAKMTEPDMQALYAYLMAQPAVESQPPESSLRFPFNLRPLLSGWKVLFHQPEVYRPDPDRSVLWNRGAYLVEGAGHCAACHSPRNALGAEKKGLHHLSGGVVDGWEAPSLTASSKSPQPWTEDELFAYLRTGFSARHGVAAGPMAPVVSELAQLPAEDVRAITHYIASLGRPPAATATAAVTAGPARASAPAAAGAAQSIDSANGKRLFTGACAACHMEGSGPTLFGVRPSLKVNTNVHADTPDNLVKVILHGIPEPANADLGYMPGFANSFSDAQVRDLLHYLRATFAPDKPAWTDVEARIAAARRQPGH